ncbi:MAG TPA: TlyA family RNA methyltransferase [Caulobacterales bacterium]|nr:TlyA family RNA methyltransferase [Caulobacterales bacterium]
MARLRADLLLVARGLARSRAQAQAAIEAGGVTAAGRTIAKASEMVPEDAALEFAPAHQWVSRGGVKLEAALDRFGVDVAGKIALDVGAATGGFTQVLLARGAARVFAVDVGRGQFDAALAADPRVVVLEGQDARTLTQAEITTPPQIIVCDASFIGAEKVLARPLELAAAQAELTVLIKPQFESGPRRKALIEQEEARHLAEETAGRLDGLNGFRAVQFAESPLLGGRRRAGISVPRAP